MQHLTKHFYYLLIIVSLMGVTACQKEITDPTDTGNNNLPNDFKVKKYREDYTSTTANYSNTFNLTYDSNNRLLTLIDSANSTTKQVYTYNSNNTYTLDFYNSGILFVHEDFFLNSVPFIDSTSQYNDTGDTTLEKNIYDGANHLITVIDYDYTTATGPQLFGTTDFTYDANGNVTQETDNSTGGVRTNEFLADLNTIDLGKPYEPRNKNLIKKETVAEGGSTYTIDHTYTFDSVNRVTSDKATYSSGEILLKTYSY